MSNAYVNTNEFNIPVKLLDISQTNHVNIFDVSANSSHPVLKYFNFDII